MNIKHAATRLRCGTVASILIFGLLALRAPSAQAADAVVPELPRVYIDTTMPVQNGAILTVDPASNCNGNNGLQAKINAASLGDTIVIPAGHVCIGDYVLRNKATGSGWIVIKSSKSDELPENVRVKPGDTSKMATIMATNGGTAILVEDGAHHYRLIGLEVTINPQYTGWTYNLILLRPNSNTGFIYAQTPKHITLDRLYLHGRRNLTLFRAVYMDGEFLAAINCYASEIHVAGFDSQAMGGSNGGGPFKLTNNYLEASGENIMFGGTRTQTLDLMPQDIEIRGNYLYKPWTWKYDSGKTLPSTCFWDSSYGTSGENFELKDAAGNSLGWYQCSSGKWINRDITLPITKWTVKNLFELKNAQRVLVEGNVLQNNWQQAQNGIAVLYNGVDGNTSTIEHITFRNNIVLNAQRAVSASANAYSMQLRSTNTLLFENNFFKLFFPRDIYNGTEGGGISLPPELIVSCSAIIRLLRQAACLATWARSQRWIPSSCLTI